jgi:hypothetical protein
MPILRLTQKFAKDIKVNKLLEPPQVSKILDDWAIDRLTIKRKKIAIITHARSYLTFFIPYTDVGGAKNIPECIGILLSQWLNDQDLWGLGEQAANLFQDKIVTYCKTVDRKLLGHMNDFKKGVEARVYYHHKDFPDINWDEESELINDIPITIANNKCTTPERLMLHLLGEKGRKKTWI